MHALYRLPGFFRRNQPHCHMNPADYQYALVVNHRSGDLAVIRVRALTELQPRTKTAPLFTMIPVGSEPVSAAVAAV